MGEAVIVSACLVGISCRYDGSDKKNEQLIDDLKDAVIIPICPEQMGGLSTPRDSSEIDIGDGNNVISDNSRVVTKMGKDLTGNFLHGAGEVLRVTRIGNVKRAYLKERSPSCGVKTIMKNGKEMKGMGVLTALFMMEDIEVFGV